MIRDAYERAAKIIAAKGQSPESLTVAAEVERLRLAWRPSCVRVVMLAESHVWTFERDTTSRVQQPDGTETGFARFVYCLGYGEPSLVAPDVSPNSGTGQYWRLFHYAVRGPEVSSEEISGKAKPERILAKLRLLNELKLAGIWLVDASVTALYKPGGERLLSSRNDYKEVLRACWEAHVANVIAGCSPSAVLIVGKGVNKALGELVAKAVPQAKICVVMQPNAHMTPEVRSNERRAVFDFCSRHRSN
jgi:hypothetical protein